MQKDPLDDRILQRAARPARHAGSGCLDAEVLAAWADGTLTNAERDAAESHAADCERCLMLLAAIAKTAPPPSVAESRPWQAWRWLVPLATASIVITAWVMVQDPPPPERPQVSVPAAEGLPVPQRDASAAARQQHTSAVDDQAAKNIAPDSPSAPLALESRSQRRADDPAIARVLDDVRVTPGEARLERKEAAAAADTAAVTASSPPVTAAPRAAETFAASQFRAAAAPLILSSPDPNVRWRVTGTTVERSSDGGKSWQQQTTGTRAALTAGSSPAPTICWIVGRTGTVLLTTDGQTWRRLEFTDPKADLVAVSAVDGSRATVTTADGRIYVTADGGASWRLQEIASSPF